jgi:transglutaminase superfamily protein
MAPTPPLPAPDRPAAWRVVLVAAAVPLLLRLVRVDRLGPWLEPRREPPAADPRDWGAMVRRLDRLRRAGRPLVRSGCLTRAITLYYFLRRAGAPATLHFGMGAGIDGDGAPADGFAGHSWVELDGEPVAEPRDPRPLYAEMLRYPR